MEEADYLDTLMALSQDLDDVTPAVLALAAQAVQAHPRSTKLRCLMGNLIQLGPPDAWYGLAEAQQCYAAALAIDPACWEAYQELGYFHFVVRDDPASAAAAFQAAIALGAGPDAYEGLARAQAELDAPGNRS